jgi:hypothetical protein
MNCRFNGIDGERETERERDMFVENVFQRLLGSFPYVAVA